MHPELTKFAALCCTFTAVLFTALCIRYIRKRSRVDLRIAELEAQLRERLRNR
ncbi:hypothetical protein AB4Z48_13400 [Cupriavidus sp. 2TAF22]|uniref:hypothetical protein n=1 Tax=unclassified Cupriavidus TaxID=2640874 RepID=UPI003F901886